MHRKKICQYGFKKYYAIYSIKEGKFGNCKDLPPKYITDGNSFSIK